jgi:hypothetical protein
MGADQCVRAEMAVYDPDGQLIGRVDGVPGSRMQVAGRYMVPLSMVARIEPDRVYLAAAARQYLARPVLTPGQPWPAEQWRTGDRSPGRSASRARAPAGSAPRWWSRLTGGAATLFHHRRLTDSGSSER